MRFDDGVWRDAKLHPITIGSESTLGNEEFSPAKRKCPTPASDRYADEILARLKSISTPYGAEIRKEDNIGIIE